MDLGNQPKKQIRPRNGVSSTRSEGGVEEDTELITLSCRVTGVASLEGVRRIRVEVVAHDLRASFR